MDTKQHWEQVYSIKASNHVSWFQKRAEQSLALINHTSVSKDAAIIDVGGGASNLVDDLVAEGYTDLTVLDMSSASLDVVKHRIGAHAEAVKWMVGDITQVDLPANYFDVWHDRAVFHFLIDPADRQAYLEQVMRSVRPNGYVIIATFAQDGPEMCSGLPVMRYSPEALQAAFGHNFLLVKHVKEAHRTPFATVQQFIYCYFLYSPQQGSPL